MLALHSVLLLAFNSHPDLFALVQFIFWVSLSNKLSKKKIALCCKLCKINHYMINPAQVFWNLAKLKQMLCKAVASMLPSFFIKYRGLVCVNKY